MYAPTVAKFNSKRPRPAAPKYPPAPITGPGESCGTAIAASVVNPASEISQPDSLTIGCVSGFRAKSMASSMASEKTR